MCIIAQIKIVLEKEHLSIYKNTFCVEFFIMSITKVKEIALIRLLITVDPKLFLDRFFLNQKKLYSSNKK